jgi:hypothetical protein
MRGTGKFDNLESAGLPAITAGDNLGMRSVLTVLRASGRGFVGPSGAARWAAGWCDSSRRLCRQRTTWRNVSRSWLRG